MSMSQMATTLAQRLETAGDITDTEIQQLKAMGMEIYTDLICVGTEDILQAWQTGTGTVFEKDRLTEVMKGWYYLEEKDQWYSQAGGVEYADVICADVSHENRIYTIVTYYHRYEDMWGVAWLRQGEEGQYTFERNTLYYTPYYKEESAPEGFYATAVKRMEESRDTWMQGILAADKNLWFTAYNGDDLQVLDGDYSYMAQWPGVEDGYDWYGSPMYCDDIVYYRPAEDETIEEIAAAMMEAMVERMTEPSEIRPFTITKYQIMEQNVKSTEEVLKDLWKQYRRNVSMDQAEPWKDYLKRAVTYDGRAPIGEDMWCFIPYGYYAFEGMGILGTTMEDEINAWPEGVMDGMVTFQAQGSDDVFLFILMKEGDVYRLQRAQGMMHSLEGMQKDAENHQEMVDYFTEYFSDWRHRAFLEFPIIKQTDFYAPRVMKAYAMYQLVERDQHLVGQELLDSLTDTQRKQ